MQRISTPRLLVPALCFMVVAGSGCERATPSNAGGPAASASTTAPAPAPAPAKAGPLESAEQAAKLLGGRLKQRLTEAMTQGGPAKAIEVCATEAQQIAAKVKEETGAKVGRASLRLRNPADAGPDWVEAWLKEQGERKAEGAPGVRAVVDTPEGKRARVIKPIAVEPLCAGCHGDPAQIAPEVKAVLEQKYPGDKATGYGVGDLRGALWAEVPAS